MSAFDFDPTAEEPSRGSGMPAVPPGLYMAHLVSFEEEVAKSGKGKLRSGVWEITEPVEYAGTVIFANVNTHHESEQAQKIGRSELSAIMLALFGPGRAPDDSDEMLGIPICVRVKFIPEGYTEPAKGGRAAYTHTKDKNEIVAYLSPDQYNPDAPRASLPAKAAQAATPAAAPAATRYQPVQATTAAATPAAAHNGRPAPWGQRRAV